MSLDRRSSSSDLKLKSVKALKLQVNNLGLSDPL